MSWFEHGQSLSSTITTRVSARAVILWITASWMSLFLLSLVGCSEADRPVGVEQEDLWSIPVPHFEDVEPAVRDRLREAQDGLDKVLRSGAPTPSLGQSMGEMGKLYHAHGFHEAAEACYLNARRLRPRDFSWAYLLGRLYRKLGDWRRSEQSLDEALALQPGDVPTLIALGHLRREENRLNEAAAAFESALSHDPDSVAALIGLGRIELAREDFTAAAGYLEDALQRAPYATEIHYPLGLTYRGLGRMEEAKSFLSRRGTVGARFNDPLMDGLVSLETGMRLHLNRGTAAFTSGQYEDAVHSLREAVKADPKSSLARVNLAAALTQIGDREGALEHTQAARQENPKDARANFGLATLLAQQGRDLDALEFYQQAIETDPSYRDAHFNYANALRRLGHLEAAGRHFGEVVRLEPHHAVARFGQVLSLAQRGEWQDAMELTEKGYELLDGHQTFADALVRLLSACPVDSLRDGERALKIAEDLFRKDRSLSHLEGLAMASAELGRFPEAVRFQEAAVRAVEAAGKDALAAKVAVVLELYRNDQPCRTPWLF